MTWRKFSKKERSTFTYWFWHWIAFNWTAKKLGVWRPKYIVHDIEKPWLKLFMDYNKVQKWHRSHNNHHIAYGRRNGFNKMDWRACVIDWECSRLTKENCPRNAREEVDFLVSGGYGNEYSDIERMFVSNHCYPILTSLGL